MLRLVRRASLVLATQDEEAAGSAAVAVSRRQIPPPPPSLVHDSTKYDRELPLLNKLFGVDAPEASDIFRNRFQELGAFANFSCPCTDPTCIEKACSSIKPVQPPLPKKEKKQNASSNSASDAGASVTSASSGTGSTPTASPSNTGYQRPSRVGYRTFLGTALRGWLNLEEDAIDGIVASAGAAGGAPVPVTEDIIDVQLFRDAYEELRLASEIAMKVDLPLDADLLALGLMDATLQFLSAKPLVVAEEVVALETSLDCPPPSILESKPETIEALKNGALASLVVDVERAWREGGAPVVIKCLTLPAPLISVAVRMLTGEEQTAVAYLLREERLNYLRSLAPPADAPRKCPCCGTVVHSLVDARAHLRTENECGWKLIKCHIPKEQLFWCRGCKNPYCDRGEGGTRPWLEKKNRDIHERAQTRKTKQKPQKRQRICHIRRKGYFEKVRVYVDYEGALLGADKKKRRKAFDDELGEIIKIGANGVVTILFDTLEPRIQPFQDGFTLRRVDGGAPPLIRPRFSRKRKASA